MPRVYMFVMCVCVHGCVCVPCVVYVCVCVCVCLSMCAIREWMAGAGEAGALLAYVGSGQGGLWSQA